MTDQPHPGKIKPPCKRPCGSCPYRLDAPAGLWHSSEYFKLIEFDRPTVEQPGMVFMCHQQDGHLCAGWVGVHDMQESLGLRLECSAGNITPEEFNQCVDYTTDVPLHESGMDAAAHGIAGIPNPSPKTQRYIERLEKRGLATRYKDTE